MKLRTITLSFCLLFTPLSGAEQADLIDDHFFNVIRSCEVYIPSPECDTALIAFNSVEPNPQDKDAYDVYYRLFNKFFITNDRAPNKKSIISERLSIDRSQFCSMYKALLSTTGLLEASELSGLDKHLPGYQTSKQGIERSLADLEPELIAKCL